MLRKTLAFAALAGILLSCNTLSKDEARQVYFDEAASPASGLPDPSLPGTFTARSFLYAGERNPRRPEYAREKLAIVTKPVDISAYFSPDFSIIAMIFKGGAYLDTVKAGHWGFDEHAVPLNGKVWYPDGAGPFPVVVCVHGNHDAYEVSEFGYDWLGQLLATRGYVFASIDENFINARTDGRENDARAALLLEHARTILGWNADPSTPVFGKLDTARLALIGHSRGGEAAVTAAMFNDLSSYPEDAALRFDWNLPVRAVIALAPVEGQYRPAKRSLPLPAVDYLVLQGSADGDVDADLGLRWVNRGYPAPGNFRSSFWIYGANHAQFNSDWAKRQDPSPTLRSNLLTVSEQQKAAAVIISAFLETTFDKEPGYSAFLKDWRRDRSWLPTSVYLSQYRDGNARPIADFEEDGDPATTTDPAWKAEARGFVRWSEGPLVIDTMNILGISVLPEMLTSSDLFSLGSWAARLQWAKGKPAEYILKGPARSGGGLSFDMAAYGLPEEDELLDFTIIVVTDAGVELSLPFTDRYRQTQVPGTWIGTKGYSRPQILSSFRIPFDEKVGVAELRFRFDRTSEGTVLLDNVAILEETAE